MRVDVYLRIERFGQLIRFMEEDKNLWGETSPLGLHEEERRETLGYLEGDIYNMNRRVRSYVMLGLDSFLSDGACNLLQLQGPDRRAGVAANGPPWGTGMA